MLPAEAKFRKDLVVLRRNFRVPVDLYATSGIALDPETGNRGGTRIKYAIDQAVVVPQGLQSSIMTLAARGAPTGANVLEKNTLRVLLDAHRPPLAGVTITTENYLVIAGERYEVARVVGMGSPVWGWDLTAVRLTGVAANQIINLNAYQQLRASQRQTCKRSLWRRDTLVLAQIINSVLIPGGP